MQLTIRRTPNRTRRSGVAPIYLVTHHTIGGYDGSVSWLCNPAAQASADEVISKDGKRVTNLNPTRDGCYTWQVGTANPLCGAGFELEAMTTSVVFPDSLYATLAARMKARQKEIKAKYGVTIPLKHSTRKGQPGIVSHHQLAQWYGGSDHTDGDIDWKKLAAHLDPVVMVKVPAIVVSTPKDGVAGRYRLKARALLKASRLLKTHTHVDLTRGTKSVPKDKA